MRTGHYDLAVDDFSAVIELDPDNVQAYRERAGAESLLNGNGGMPGMSAIHAHHRDMK